MARNRTKSQDTAIAQLIVLGVVGCAFSPFLRGLMLWSLIAIVAVLAVAVIYRLLTRSQRLDWAASTTPQTQAPASLRSAASMRTTVAVVTSNSSVNDTNPNREVKALDWFQFEKLIEAVYEQQGYSVQRSGGAKPDGGIDLVLSKDGITSAVQCKHWKSWKVGVKQIREFIGALTDRGIQNGILVTLQEYTREAKELAARHHIHLIGESELNQMLRAVNWKTNPTIVSILNDKHKICPKCESEMVLRTAKKGSKIGSQFWGCSTYPRCKQVLEMNR